MKKLVSTLITLCMGGALCAQGFVSQNNTDFAATLSDPKVQLIDVRTPQEYISGHIPGAINMDIRSKEFNTQAAALDKNRPVALYCRSGLRSKAAAKRLFTEGYTVYELDGGLMDWKGKTK